MTMRSLRTRVPPVTALRSPPLSRMTGADSPVMAGIIGSVIGCLMGFGFCLALASLTGGKLPVDPALGQYDSALLLAAAASIVAALSNVRTDSWRRAS